jgi:hypothetical protein
MIAAFIQRWRRAGLGRVSTRLLPNREQPIGRPVPNSSFMSTSIFGRAVAAASALGLVSVAAACGSPGQSFRGLGPGETGDGGAPRNEPGTTSDASIGGGGDDSGGAFAGSDDGGAPAATNCQPGTYTGMFNTQVTNDAGLLFSLFTVAWSGKLTIVLRGQTSSVGGEIPTSTLTIAPGAQLNGMDSYMGTFIGNLSGQLDCTTRQLTGTLSNAEYLFFSSDASTLALSGTLSGTYDDEGGAPVISGALTISSPMASGSGAAAAGTWTATLQ